MRWICTAQEIPAASVNCLVIGHLASRLKWPWGPGNTKLKEAMERLPLYSKAFGNCGLENGPSAIWGSHFEKQGKATLSGSGWSRLPVNEQELGQTAQQVTQHQSYPSWSLRCFEECPRAPLKWQGLRKDYPLGSPPPFLLMQRCYHTRWPHTDHGERQVHP